VPLALKQPLAGCAVSRDLVDVDLLVPACYREKVVCGRELEVLDAVLWKLALRHLDVLAGVAGGGACRRRCC
jgi:hypothetical protein